MGYMEGTRALKSYVGDYSFAVDGGAISAIVLRSDDGPIPAGSIIYDGGIEVLTVPTAGGAATIAVHVEAANDLQTAITIAGAPWSTTGRKAITPVSFATSVKTTVSRAPTITIAAFALTAGIFRVYLFYR